MSLLWDSWPLDAIIGDARAGQPVDAHRIVRIADPAHPHIGGPSTLPIEVSAKPPWLVGVPDLTQVLAWSQPDTGLGADAALPIRAALGLGASRAVAQACAPVFGTASQAAQV